MLCVFYRMNQESRIEKKREFTNVSMRQSLDSHWACVCQRLELTGSNFVIDSQRKVSVSFVSVSFVGVHYHGVESKSLEINMHVLELKSNHSFFPFIHSSFHWLFFKSKEGLFMLWAFYCSKHCYSLFFFQLNILLLYAKHVGCTSSCSILFLMSWYHNSDTQSLTLCWWAMRIMLTHSIIISLYSHLHSYTYCHLYAS